MNTVFDTEEIFVSDNKDYKEDVPMYYEKDHERCLHHLILWNFLGQEMS